MKETPDRHHPAVSHSRPATHGRLLYVALAFLSFFSPVLAGPPTSSRSLGTSNRPEDVCGDAASLLSNATGLADECDGLRRAYVTFCRAEASESAPCCSALLRNYRGRCRDLRPSAFGDRDLLVIVLVLCLCGFVRSAIRHFEVRRLPEVAGCILVGVAAGIVVELCFGSDVAFDERLFLRVLLPPIVFEAALSIDKRALRRHAVPILGYAVAGTVLSSFLVGAIVRLEGTLPWIESLAFGTLISSIDPVATLAVLNAVGVDETDTLYILIFGEALLNDGVAVVLFENLVSFMDDAVIVDTQVVSRAVLDFFKVALGSCLVGTLCGACCTLYFQAVRGWQTPLIEVLLFFLWSLIPYYICDGLEWSGIVAIVVMGILMDLCIIGSPHADPTLLRRLPWVDQDDPSAGCLSAVGTRHVRFVVEVISTLMETTIFAYLGMFMFSTQFHWNVALVLLACLGAVLSRGVMVAALSVLLNGIETCHAALSRWCGGSPAETGAVRYAPHVRHYDRIVIDRNVQAVLFFSGLRGAMSFALVENIPAYDAVTGAGSRYTPELKAMTSSTIFFTIFLFGGMTYDLLERCGFAPAAAAVEGGVDDGGGLAESLLDPTERRMEMLPYRSPQEDRGRFPRLFERPTLPILQGSNGTINNEGSLPNDLSLQQET